MRSDRVLGVGVGDGVGVSSVTSAPGHRLGGFEISRVELAGVNFEELATVVAEGAVRHRVLHALSRLAESVSDEAKAPPRRGGEHVAVVPHHREARLGMALTSGYVIGTSIRGVEVTAATPTDVSNLLAVAKGPAPRSVRIG